MNFKLLEYSLNSITRSKGKFIFIYLIFTMIISVCLALFHISSGLKTEALYTLNNLPDILVQKQLGGRQQFIKTDIVENIVILPGVTGAYGRIWGFYPFEYLNTNLTIVGIDIFAPQQTETIKSLTKGLNTTVFFNEPAMLAGQKLTEIIHQVYGKDEFSFQSPAGEYITLKMAGTLNSQSQMVSTGTVITDMDSAAKITGIPNGYFADIAVNTANQQEISTIAEKIRNMSPSYKVTTKEVIAASYQNMFDFKGGIFLLFFVTAIMTFFMIIFDKMSGISGAEAKEISILKSIGWSTGDILKVKLYESATVSVTAFISAVFISLFYVFILNAPGLQNIFMGYSYLKPVFEIPFTFDPALYFTVFFITVPVYTAAVIIPSWKTASRDPGEVVR